MTPTQLARVLVDAEQIGAVRIAAANLESIAANEPGLLDPSDAKDLAGELRALVADWTAADKEQTEQVGEGAT